MFLYMAKGRIQAKHEGKEQNFNGLKYKDNGEESAKELILYCIMV